MLHICQILSFLGFHSRSLNLSPIQIHLMIKPFSFFAGVCLECCEDVCKTAAIRSLSLTTERVRMELDPQRMRQNPVHQEGNIC